MSLLGESQQMLGDMVGRYLADNHDFEARQASLSEEGWPSTLWSAFADELGIIGLPFSEAQGGLGLGPLDIMVVMEALGRGLAAEPFLSTVVGFGGLVNALGTRPALSPLVADVIGGEARVALVLTDAQGAAEPGDRTLTRDGGAWTLKGGAAIVPAAAEATHVAISARTDAGAVALIILAKNAGGLSWSELPLIDGSKAAQLEIDARLDEAAIVTMDGAGAIQAAHDAVLAALCAEITGIIAALIDITVDFATQRAQFGKPIAKFQVIQHRMADMYVEGELTRSMALLAALKLDAATAETHAAVTACKARAGKAGRMVGQNAIQIHGGIGTTDELIVGHYYKRLLTIEALYGCADSHIKDYAEQRAALGYPIAVV